ncbi:MAG: hypothetical protein JO001_26875 [Alphaproteobacteria bacterium]|nr:hypothetical protein [Alphaproteobacteria bacterium]
MYTITAGLVALALAAAPDVDKADCGNLTNHRTAAVSKVMEALHSYEKCLGAAVKGADCADEMQALDDAHDDFVDAAADAKSCP